MDGRMLLVIVFALAVFVIIVKIAINTADQTTYRSSSGSRKSTPRRFMNTIGELDPRANELFAASTRAASTYYDRLPAELAEEIDGDRWTGAVVAACVATAFSSIARMPQGVQTYIVPRIMELAEEYRLPDGTDVGIDSKMSEVIAVYVDVFQKHQHRADVALRASDTVAYWIICSSGTPAAVQILREMNEEQRMHTLTNLGLGVSMPYDDWWTKEA
jgi:hypothetical protein